MNAILKERQLGLGKSSRFLRVARVVDGVAKRTLLSKLHAIEIGRLEITDGDENYAFGPAPSPDGGAADLTAAEAPVRVTIHRPEAYSKMLFGGSVGVGESFIDGDWDAPDLTGLMRLFVRNRDALNGLDSGAANLFKPLLKHVHRLRSNGAAQARKNIVAHYDLGNDFFGLFLDPSWMYSAGIFANPATSLADAQFEKNDRICRRLGLERGDHLVEIGTGWGGFAIHAAKHYGCRVTTTTISDQQHALAVRRVNEEGLADRITLLKEDYRKLTGAYDCLVSIEMIEAVGLEYLDTYFAKCDSLLKPGGRMVLQSILIRDQYFEQARRNVDFIQTHVFPGAAIPSVRRIMESIEKRSALKLEHLKDFGQDYARTLNHWARALDEKRVEIPKLGYSTSLYRLWKYYFSYCEGGFLEKSISVGQFHFTKMH